MQRRLAIILWFLLVFGCGSSDDEIVHVDKDCADFATQAQAQEYFNSNGGSTTNNFDGLDGDNDGIACEDLP